MLYSVLHQTLSLHLACSLQLIMRRLLVLIMLDNWMLIKVVRSDVLHVKSGQGFYNFNCILLTAVIQVNPLNSGGKISFVDESFKQTNMLSTKRIYQLKTHR